MSLGLSPAEIVERDEGRALPVHPDWPRVELKDVATVQNGFAFPSSGFTSSSGTPLIRIRDVKRGSTETMFDGDYPPDYIVPVGAVLIGMDGDFNCAIWPGPDALLNQRVCRVRAKDDRLDERFLAYVLPPYLKAINDHTSSITVKHLSSRTVERIPIPLPSIDEQKQIVAEIDTQFARLDDAVTALQRARTRLKRYRASVLKAACEGRLVPTEAELARQEGRSYEPASVLLERIRAERGAAPGKRRGKTKPAPALDTSNLPELPEGWAWTTVAKLNPSDRTCAYGVLQPGPDVDRGVPFVRVGDISDGHIELSSLKHIEPSVAAQYPRTTLRGGEVLITLVGTIGRTAVVPDSLARANVARAVGVIPLVESIHSRWVEIWFRNPTKVREMVGKSHEVARKTLNLEDVREALVAIPPLEEQQRINTEVERLMSISEQMAATVEANLKRAESLRQSILRLAFSGQLVRRAVESVA